MNEVEKMYENVKVYDFRYDCDVSFTDGQSGRITNCSKGEVKDYCTNKKYFKSAKVINYKHLYPPFTAEKQLELIKWMIKTNHRYFIQDIIADDFSETLAGVFNLYWQDLTEEERKQIKEILE